jgi:hypothetical protein
MSRLRLKQRHYARLVFWKRPSFLQEQPSFFPNKVILGRSQTPAHKKLGSLVAKCCKIRKIYPCEIRKF